LPSNVKHDSLAFARSERKMTCVVRFAEIDF
jgi:hypothetical protein